MDEDCDPRIGTTLKGEWRLDARLGVGGMATFYTVTHRTGKRVAVEMLHGELSTIPEIRARFSALIAPHLIVTTAP